MSVYASRWALDQLASPDCTLSPTARAVLLVLAAEANHRTGDATAGQRRLATVLGVHADTAYRAVRELRAMPWLPVIEIGGKGLRWRFPVSPDIAEAVAEETRTPRAHADGPSSTPPAPTRGVELSTPPAPAHPTPRADAGGPPAPTRGKGSGLKKGGAATVRDETREARAGAEEVSPRPLDQQEARAIWRAERDAERGATREEAADDPHPWIAEGLKYGEWQRRERAAGRVRKHNPARGAG